MIKETNKLAEEINEKYNNDIDKRDQARNAMLKKQNEKSEKLVKNYNTQIHGLERLALDDFLYSEYTLWFTEYTWSRNALILFFYNLILICLTYIRIRFMKL